MKLADVPTNTMFVADGLLYLKIHSCHYTKSILQEWRKADPLEHMVCLLITDDDDFELYILRNDNEVALYER